MSFLAFYHAKLARA